MKIKVIETCDVAMAYKDVAEFVSAVYLAAEKKTSAKCVSVNTKSREPVGEPWIELHVGLDLERCHAYLVDEKGVLGEFRTESGMFHQSGKFSPYMLS